MSTGLTSERATASSTIPDGVRLHMFECGTLKCHVENIKMNQGLGEEYEIPVPWFLIEHPHGLVVIDGGNAAECASDARGHWGDICDVYWPEMTAEQACVPALRAAGFDPADVVFILQSHLHLDHTGAIGAIDQFPNAQVIATRDEYAYAFAPDWFAAGGYMPNFAARVAGDNQHPADGTAAAISRRGPVTSGRGRHGCCRSARGAPSASRRSPGSTTHSTRRSRRRSSEHCAARQ